MTKHKPIPAWVDRRPVCGICGAKISGYLKRGQEKLSWRHRSGARIPEQPQSQGHYLSE